MSVAFRPHHFLCTLCYQGKGYSSSFVKNYTQIFNKLNAPDGDAVEITVVGHTDSICTPCPHRQEKHCASEEKVVGLDIAHAAALDVKPGDVMTWGEAKQKIAERMTLDVFHRICETCSWKKLGICESVLQKFLDGEKAN